MSAFCFRGDSTLAGEKNYNLSYRIIFILDGLYGILPYAASSL